MSDPTAALKIIVGRRGTKAQIEAESGGTLEPQRLAYATDTSELGIWTNGAWVWSPTAAGITISDEGTPLATAATELDFVGAGVTASGTGAIKTITIPGGSTYHGCRVRNAGDQTVASGATTPLGLDTEDYDTDTYHFTSSANLTGTVAKTSGSATIVGTGTSFTTELSVNQVVSIPGTAAEIGVVKTITDNTHLTLWQNMANTASGQTATRKNNYIAIPSGLAGKYHLFAGARWLNATASKTDLLLIKANGTIVAVQTVLTSAATAVSHFGGCDTDYPLSAGDYVEFDFQNNESGNVTVNGAANYSPVLGATLLGA